MFYSQQGQDRKLEKFVFKGYKNGVFVDVGAHDGVSFNNTKYFEDTHNWTGINIEPIEKVYNKLVKNRPNCININCAVSNNNGIAKFYNSPVEMLSGLAHTYDKRHQKRLLYETAQAGGNVETLDITTKKLETILDENNISHINYLSIDVEGAEFEVIKSINFEKVFIDIIGFENNFNDSSVPIIRYLETKNFKVVVKEGDIMMANKKSEFL